jgi:hypothetical protein
VDDLIARGLSAEDRDLLARHSEPGYVSQAFGLFRGSWSWVMWLVNISAALSFLAAIYALWQLYAANEVLAAVKWGVAGLLLFQFTALGKTFMGSHLEANRLLREIKRVELQMSLLRSEQPTP